MSNIDEEFKEGLIAYLGNPHLMPLLDATIVGNVSEAKKLIEKAKQYQQDQGLPENPIFLYQFDTASRSQLNEKIRTALREKDPFLLDQSHQWYLESEPFGEHILPDDTLEEIALTTTALYKSRLKEYVDYMVEFGKQRNTSGYELCKGNITLICERIEVPLPLKQISYFEKLLYGSDDDE